jgi:hypothetical protein
MGLVARAINLLLTINYHHIGVIDHMNTKMILAALALSLSLAACAKKEAPMEAAPSEAPAAEAAPTEAPAADAAAPAEGAPADAASETTPPAGETTPPQAQ